MPELVVNCKQALADVHAAIDAAWERSKFFRVVIREKRRSLSQNDQAHVWYAQAAQQTGEYSELGAKCLSKLMVGVPILCAEDSDFRNTWEESFAHLPFRQKMKVMKILPVTSLMSVKSAGEYLTELQDYWLEHRGIVLEFNKPKG